MAASLRFAARKLCGRAFQRLPQPYFTAAAEAALREEQRRLFASIRHVGSSLRRFSSSESPNLVNNTKRVTNTACGAAESSQRIDNTGTTSSPSLWSPRNQRLLTYALGYAFALYAGCYATIYVQTQRRGGPVVWKDPDDIKKN